MKSLAEQLLREGLVSEQRFRKAEEERRSKQTKDVVVTRDRSVADEGELDACGTMQEFKQIAKEILLRDPRTIGSIIRKAHRFKNVDKGGSKQFIRFFYEVRDKLDTLPTDKQQKFLRTAFGRRGSTLETE